MSSDLPQANWNNSTIPNSSFPSFGGGGGAPLANGLPDPSSEEMFSANFLSDLGLLSSNGQLIDYFDQANTTASGGTGASFYGSGSTGGGGSSIGGGPSPSDSLDLSFLGFGNGGQDGKNANGQDATQALFNQLTAGW